MCILYGCTNYGNKLEKTTMTGIMAVYCTHIYVKLLVENI